MMESVALPDVFLPYQQRFMAAIYAEPVVVVEKSRRTGYSWTAAAAAALMAAATRAAGGMDVLYMGYNLEMAREFIDYVAEWTRAVEPAAAEIGEEMIGDGDKAVQAFRVKFASGHKVLALPSAPRALRGMQGLVIIDEAAFHDDLEGLLKAAFALLIWGGKVAIISTHDGDSNPFAALVNDIRAGRRPYKLQRCTFDEALAEGLYRRICLTTGESWSPEAEAAWRQEIIDFYGDAAEEELFVVPSAATGSFLPGALIEARMADGIPIARLAQNDEWGMQPEHLRQADIRDWCEEMLRPPMSALGADTPHVFGFDIARKGDLSEIWLAAIGADLVRRAMLVVELRNLPFGQIRQVLWWVLDRVPRLRAGAMDATGLGMQMAEETGQKYGARIMQVMLNDAWYRENMPPWKAAFEDAMVVLPRDRDILSDHRAVQLVKGIAKVVERTGETGRKRHGDSAIAHVLAHAASRTDAEEYDYEPVREAAKGTQRWHERPPEDEDGGDRKPGWMPDLRGRAFG
ncbi:MAG: hypothetical protein ACYCZB_18190 [Acidiphilium sp.]